MRSQLGFYVAQGKQNAHGDKLAHPVIYRAARVIIAEAVGHESGVYYFVRAFARAGKAAHTLAENVCLLPPLYA